MSSIVVADQRFIATKVGNINLIFPAQLVTETLLVERAKILPLPFYNPMILGCVRAGGEIIPLVSSAPLLSVQDNLIREMLSVVFLGESAEHLARVGVVVDQILGSQMQSQLPQDHDTKLFDPTLFEKALFYPQRWRSES